MQRRNARGCIRPDEMVLVADLANRFAAFRRGSPRFARVPHELREAVVAAIRQGVPPGLLRRECGVSTSQLDHWQVGFRHSGASRSGDEPPKARAFSVVGAGSPSSSGSTDWANGDALELRIGPWSISVRMASQQDIEDGEPRCCR